MVPLQRWLNVPALILLVFGPSLGGQYASELGIIGLVLVLIVPAFLGGLLWRTLSAQRASTLRPFARVRLLSGVALTVAVAAALVAAHLALVQLATPPALLDAAALGRAFLVAAGAGFALMILMFVLSGGGFTALGVLMLIWLPNLSSRFPALAAPLRPFTNSGGLAVIAAGIAFVSWYLRARRIRAPNWRSIAWGASSTDEIPVQPSTTRTSSSIGTLLWGELFRTRFRPRNILVAGVFVLPAALLMTGAGSARLAAGLTFAAMLPAILALLGWAYARMAAARCRYLWLKTGATRAALFAQCERRIWLHWLLFGAPFLLALPASWQYLPHPAASGAYVLLASLVPACVAIYIGMNPQGWPWPNAPVALIVWVTWIMTAMLPWLDAEPIAEHWPLMAGGLAGVVVLRAYVRHRWSRMDWTVCRPTRLPARGLSARA
ncbi:MAG TPA: hypothetical protein VF931_04050 [Steroidobacteraceae bacterium]